VYSIVETAMRKDNLQGFLYAVERLKLWDTLDKRGPYTVLAPHDRAFKEIPDRLFDELMDTDVMDIAYLLDNHFVHGILMLDEIKKLKSLTTVNGSTINVLNTNDGTYIEEARVIESDIACTNGVIHILDRLLVPEEIRDTLRLREIEEAPGLRR